MLIDDDVLPAARHLTGPGSLDVLRTTVAAAGGQLTSARPCHVQYRPGSDLVVRYDARVAWRGGSPVVETLLAATTRHGVLPGTVPLTASTDDGELEVGVWRWPFDPCLPGLATAVTPTTAAPLLDVAAHEVHRLALQVVAYRPTERAVVRATVTGGPTRYLKVVAPASLPALVERHERLLAAGVPVPAVVASDADAGVLVMHELTGPTLRDRLKADESPWPDAAEYRRISAALAAADVPAAPAVRSRVSNAIGHAAMLGEVLPDLSSRLASLTEALGAARRRSKARSGAMIHGDLYEAQLVVDGGRVTGLLDIDDVGPGDPLDDRATVLGHLRYRAAITPAHGDRIGAYADELRADFARDVDPVELDIVTGAVLVGLATGPFRIQQRDWPTAVRTHLAAAEALIDPARRP